MASSLTINSLRGRVPSELRSKPPRLNSLTDEQAIEIYAAKGTTTAQELSEKIGVSKHIIYDIWARRTYAAATVSMEDKSIAPSNSVPPLIAIQILQLKPVSAAKVAEYFNVSESFVFRLWSGQTQHSLTEDLACS
ncbi:MAG: hypothetical protein AAF745_11150 [Planctomycetota bacterium]